MECRNNAKSRFTCKMFYFLLAYIKIAYYFCMLPFTAIIDDSGNLEFKYYRPHQAICFLFHLSSLYFGSTNLWKITNESFKNGSNSTSLYHFALFAILLTAILLAIFNCWFVKPNPYKILLTRAFNHVENYCSQKDRRFAMLLVTVFTFVQIFFTTSVELASQIGFIIDFIQNPSFHPKPLSLILRFVTVFLEIYYQFLFQITVIVPFGLSSFCMYLIGQSFKDSASIEYAILASPNTKWHHQSLERLTDNYLCAKSLAKVLNNAFGKSLIIILLSTLPTLGYGLSCMLSNVTVSAWEHVRTVYILCALYLFLMLAAKGNSNVQNFGHAAFEQLWKADALKIKSDGTDEKTKSLLLTIMQYVNSSNVGVGGTPFFIVTYRLVGTMTSALITYTIIMFQFQK